MPAGGMMTASIAAPIVGGIVGNMMGSGDRRRAREAAARAMAEIMALGLPPDLSREVIMREFQKAGMLDPEMEQHIDAGISDVANIKEDGSLRDAQTHALQIMQQTGQTGFGAQDRAAMNKIKEELAVRQQGVQDQIIQEYKQKGMSGAGMELAAKLQAAQGGSNQASMSGDQVAADASMRALEAMTRAGSMAGDLRGQDFDVANTKATAADQFKRFNVENQMNVNARNIGSRNSAQAANLDNAQRIQDSNTNQYNQEKQRQNQAQRDYWQDQAQYRQMRSNAHTGQAQQFQNSADRTAQQWQSIGSGVGQGAGAYANYSMGQKPQTTTRTQGFANAVDNGDDTYGHGDFVRKRNY